MVSLENTLDTPFKITFETCDEGWRKLISSGRSSVAVQAVRGTKTSSSAIIAKRLKQARKEITLLLLMFHHNIYIPGIYIYVFGDSATSTLAYWFVPRRSAEEIVYSKNYIECSTSFDLPTYHRLAIINASV